MRVARSLALFAWAASLAGCIGFNGQHLTSAPSRSAGAEKHESEKNAKEAFARGKPPIPHALCITDPPAGFNPAPAQLRLVSAEEPANPEFAVMPALAAAVPTAPNQQEAEPISHDDRLRLLHRQASHRMSLMDTYALRMRRREAVGGKTKPEEVIECKFRQAPFSVHMKWVGNEGKGREVIYVNGQHDGMIHTLTASGDIPLLPGGQRFRVAPDSAMVRNRSRHSIKEAGIETLVDRFGKLVEDHTRAGGQRTLRYVGLLKRPEFEQKVECVFQVIPAKSEAVFPNGGQRLWFFDGELGLPVLVVSLDEQKREVEYYCFDRFQYPAHLTDSDFHPDRVWK
ncbi:MAG: DUF1571 domain-containing protein [Gemmataceae bacterium]